ncbi:MAG: hypothetical protein WBX25_03025 [Rhodomicrobium sp.]
MQHLRLDGSRWKLACRTFSPARSTGEHALLAALLVVPLEVIALLGMGLGFRADIDAGFLVDAAVLIGPRGVCRGLRAP